MSRTAALADHLDDRTDAIIASWRAAVEREGDVPDALRLSRDEFIDHVPQILDRLSDRLRGSTDAEVNVEGKQHGRVRWKQGYQISEVIAEIGHLRTALLRSTFAHARENSYDVSTIERACESINEVLDEAAAASIEQYQIDSRAKTDQILAEVERRNETIDAERSKLKTVLGNLPVGVWVINADGGVVGLNREAERLQSFAGGRPTNLAIGGDNLRVFAPDGRPLTTDELPAMRAIRGEHVVQQEVLWQVGDRTRTITSNAAPLFQPDGTIVGGIVVAEDVSERVAMKSRLERSESRFRAIAEHTPAMIWRADAEGRFDFFNRTWANFLGLTIDEAIRQGWAAGIHADDLAGCLAELRRGIAGREPFEMTYRRLRHDGVYRSVVDRGTPYFDAQGRPIGYLGSCLDITARVDQQEAVERQSEHKSRLMAALSHDARTPLNAVFLAAQLLETQVRDQDDREVQESLRVIRNSVKNVLDLLSDLLDLTRIDAGAMPAEVARFALEPTLSECLSSIEPQARAKGLDVRFEPDGLSGINLATDRNKLKQILANFLSNALRYTERGHIRLFGNAEGDSLRISVEDTGVGIAAKDHARIFDEFATLGKGRRESSDGTGLGLAICRRLAGLLRGEIELSSEPGRGSTFTLVLPKTLIDDREVASLPPVVAVSPESGPILIAEDHEPSRRALARILRRLGYRVLEAGDGGEAIAQARAERPFLVLMDINMPGVDGIEATHTLRANPATRDLPIFALTGDVTIDNQRRIGEAGVDGYLEKPVTWDQIERALGHVRDRAASPE